MIEQHQLESGVSFNIFQSSKKKARQIVTPSILTCLGNQMGELGISMWADHVLVKGPTLMDVLLESNLSIEQLRRINAVRIHRKYLYWEADYEDKFQWPRREVSASDEAFFDSVIKSYRPSITRERRYHFPCSCN